MKYYIYKIKNLVNHKVYIGLTNNIARRRTRHFSDLRRKVHDNHFLQKEYDIYGQENFNFSIEFEGDCSEQEIGDKEKEYIKKYDSYKNGYNQNEGGNFRASNGGSQLTQSDIFNILAVSEFMPRSGQILADFFGVSRTTISRINKGENHNQYKEEYEKLPEEERRQYFQIFNDSYNIQKKVLVSNNLESKRQLNKQQVFLVLYNFEYRIIPIVKLAKRLGVNSSYTLYCIRDGKTYKDYTLEYKQLTEDQKNELATLLRN